MQFLVQIFQKQFQICLLVRIGPKQRLGILSRQHWFLSFIKTWNTNENAPEKEQGFLECTLCFFFLLNSNPNSTEMCKLVPEPRLSKNFSPQETLFFQIQNLNNNNLNLFQVHEDCQTTLKRICRTKHKSVVSLSLYRLFTLWGALGINFEPQGWEGALIRALSLIMSSIHCRMAAVFRSTSVISFRRDDILLPRVQELMQS